MGKSYRFVRMVSVCLLFVILLVMPPSAGGAAEVKFVQADNKIDVMIAGKHFTSYVYGLDPSAPLLFKGGKLAKPVMYPVYSPSGVALNRGYPFAKVEGERTDHPHHMGIYFTVDIGEERFWANSKDMLPMIKHIRTTRMEGGEGSGTLSTIMHWVDRDGKALLEENRKMIFYSCQGKKQYAIDFTITLKALYKEVVFDDTKEGMFAMRVAHWLNGRIGTGRYLSSNGEETEKNVWGKRAKWMRLEGEKEGKRYGVAIFNHPRSVNYPTYWHTRDYGCFSAAPLGQYAFQKTRKLENPQPLNLTLEPGEKALFMFRVLLYDGPRTKEQLDEEFGHYSGNLVAHGGKVTKLTGGFRFTEGPASDAHGNIFFSDIPNNRIHKWSVEGEVSIFLENSGGANGLFFDKAGNLLACAGNDRRLVSIDPRGKLTVLADKYDGKRFNSLNDLWIDPKGGVYCTDPRYGKRADMKMGEHVYYITADRKKVIRVIDDFVRPNGLIGTPDGKFLYATDRGGKKTYVYTINSDGTLSHKRFFAPEASDGMTIDSRGNVYMTTDAVVVYDKDGNKIETIETPERPANVCFGGRDNQTLFITARTSLYSVPMRVKGVSFLNKVGQASGGAAGPLRVHPDNPRYFTDGSGRAVYLTGSHTWDTLVDMGQSDPPRKFDFPAYLNWMKRLNHNFLRLWTWETVTWDTSVNKQDFILMVSPHPWVRTGPGKALDGKPKFDLNKFNPVYFNRLQNRVSAADKLGIYVSVMFFEGWAMQRSPGAWEGHPFNPSNNINGIDGDVNKDGKGLEIHTLANKAVTAVQEIYVRKVIDTVNDLDNVLYEISNENHPPSTKWQYHMIRFVKNYEKSKPKQHPVGMTFQQKGGKNKILFESPAEWISPSHADRSDKSHYRNNPLAADGRKVILTDTDHHWGIGGSQAWVWKSFLRGHNPIFMDTYKDVVIDIKFRKGVDTKAIRRSMGYTLGYARRMNLVAMTPSNALASTKYCLAHPGREYLIYNPAIGKPSFNVHLKAGSYDYEWFNPSSGVVVKTGNIKTDSAKRKFKAPFRGDAVLYLKAKVKLE